MQKTGKLWRPCVLVRNWRSRAKPCRGICLTCRRIWPNLLPFRRPWWLCIMPLASHAPVQSVPIPSASTPDLSQRVRELVTRLLAFRHEDSTSRKINVQISKTLLIRTCWFGQHFTKMFWFGCLNWHFCVHFEQESVDFVDDFDTFMLILNQKVLIYVDFWLLKNLSIFKIIFY